MFLLSELQKEEVGEALHEVDFQQLKIENAQFLETIEAKNQELIQLKLASGNTLQILNAYKVRPALVPRSLRLLCRPFWHSEVPGHHCGFSESPVFFTLLSVSNFPNRTGAKYSECPHNSGCTLEPSKEPFLFLKIGRHSSPIELGGEGHASFFVLFFFNSPGDFYAQ